MKSSQPATLMGWFILASALFSNVSAQEKSIRFYGNGYTAPGNDRIKIAMTANTAVNVSNDFTIECWLKCVAAENYGSVSEADHGDGWITGNIFIDRDVYGTPETGDFGIAIGSAIGLPANHRVVAFGLTRSQQGLTIRGKTNIADNNWHHIAITRNGNTGEIKIFIDGLIDAAGIAPSGTIQYPVGRNTSYPNSDPYLVLGAEKHDAGGAYPAYSGFMDELRISNSVRYTGAFSPAVAPYTPDEHTAGLYHFNEGNGNIVKDATTENEPSNGELVAGGSPVGPVWLNETPFRNAFVLKWKDADVKKLGQKVLVSWKTNDGSSSSFEVQRSSDGRNFITIAQQNNQRVCADECKYSFTDTHPFEGKNYYRIRNTALTGEVSYSSVMALSFNQKINPYRIYQNGNQLVVQNTSSIESLVVWNSQGKRLIEKKNIQQGTTHVSLNNSTGFAFVHINLEDGTRFTEKVILR
jgi:hypothetical protein